MWMARVGLFLILAWMVLATLGGFTSAATGDAPSNQSSSTNTNGNNAGANESSSPDTGESQKGTTQLPEIVVEERSDSDDSASLIPRPRARSGRNNWKIAPSAVPGKCSKPCPESSLPSTAATARQTNIFSGASISTMAPIWPAFSNGIPINLPSNAHGEGYTDLNFLIPELIQKIDYGKGPYFANVGDFGSAGWENIQYFQTLPEGIAKVEVGSWNYERALLADSAKVGQGNLLGALEVAHTDGPWDVPENYPQIQRSADLQPGRRKPGLQRDGIGVSRHMECDQPGPGACSRRGTHRPFWKPEPD